MIRSYEPGAWLTPIEGIKFLYGSHRPGMMTEDGDSLLWLVGKSIADGCLDCVRWLVWVGKFGPWSSGAYYSDDVQISIDLDIESEHEHYELLVDRFIAYKYQHGLPEEKKLMVDKVMKLLQGNPISL